MTLPFTRDAFIDLFGIYNASWWPVVLVLWVATLVAFVLRLTGRDRSQWTWALLAFQWLWSGIAYHANLFATINPAAWLFVLLFLIQSGVLILQGVVEHRLRFRTSRDVVWFVGAGFVTYGLLYPFIALAGDAAYPRIPTFGVPCPTTIVTIGFLMLARSPTRWVVAVVPLLWAIVGTSAAVILGMHADLALPVAGVALAGGFITRR